MRVVAEFIEVEDLSDRVGSRIPSRLLDFGGEQLRVFRGREW